MKMAMEKGNTNVILLIMLFKCCAQTKCLNLPEVNLHKDLFSDYNPNVMPQENKSTPVNVTLDMFLMSIDNIDEKRQTITVKAYLEIKWRDAFLTWDPLKYAGVSSISVKNTDLWMPDVALEDTYDTPTDIGQGGIKTNVRYDGTVTIWPYKIYTVSCKILIEKFPFDIQNCKFLFYSWAHSTSVLVLNSSQKKPDMTAFVESGEWDITGSEVKLARIPFGTASFDHVQFLLKLRRKSLYYVINVIIPVLCISILNIISFLLPSESGERVTLSISIFLTLAVFLTAVNSSMPESSDEVASLSVYVGLQFLGSAFTIMFTIISLNLHHREEYFGTYVPEILKHFVKLCCVTKTNEHSQIKTDVPSENSKDYSNDTTKERIEVGNEFPHVTWKMVSRAIDRLCLITAVCWHIILTASLMISVQY